MHTLLALTEVLVAAPSVAGDVVMAAPDGEGLANAIRDFVGPLFLLAIGIAALSFLFQRQITQFLQFCALAIGVALFFYFPGVVEGLAKLLSKALS